MRKNLWCTSVLLLSLVLAGCRKGIKDPLNWKLEDLSAVNEEGKKMGLNDLKGKVWIAFY